MLLRRLQLRRLQLRRLPSNTYRSNTNSPTRKVGLFLYSTESEKVLERYLHCVEGSNKNICCYETISKICASYHSLLRCRLGSNALPARCPRGVVSLLREAEHHTSECCVPIAWSIIYICMGLSLGRLWDLGIRRYRGLWFLQLALNFLWSPMFFFMQSPISGLTIILLLDVAVLSYTIFTWRESRLASLLMLPYLAWLCLASYLNFYIWLFN